MNRVLQDPFETVTLPEVIEEYLDHGSTTCVALNSRGTICAAGCADGTVVLWDMATRGVGRAYKPHSDKVTCLAWSRNGRMLVTGSHDTHVVWWDIANNTKLHDLTMPGPVEYIDIPPRYPLRCLVSMKTGPAVLVHPRGNAPATGQDVSTPLQTTTLPVLIIESDSKTGSSITTTPTKDTTVIAVFAAQGGALLLGQSKGTLLVVDPETMGVLDVVRVAGAPKITSMSVSKSGLQLLVNGADRGVRLLEIRNRPLTDALDGVRGGGQQARSVEEVRAMLLPLKLPKQGSVMRGDDPLLLKVREFQNAVERVNWKSVAFTHDSEHVVGAPDKKDAHVLYIWSRVWGKLERILEGPKEGILYVAAHPSNSMLLSVSTTGRIYLWCTIYKDSWSAFAPDFQELEENTEYVEPEDEFDVNGKQEDPRAAAAAGQDHATLDDDSPIDIVTMPPVKHLSSDDEEEDDAAQGFWHLEVVVQPEHTTDTGGRPAGGGHHTGGGPAGGEHAVEDAAVGKQQGEQQGSREGGREGGATEGTQGQQANGYAG